MNRKFSVCLIVLMLVSVSFGMISSDSAEAAFVQPLTPSPDLPGSFTARDSAWNEAGTMAVVVGSDSSANNSFVYWANNNSYTPIVTNPLYRNQNLWSVDYYKEPVYDWPKVLIVDADYPEDGLVNYYKNIFAPLDVYADVWDVWNFGTVRDGKPNAADMAGYDLVVWVPSRLMSGFAGPGDALNNGDAVQISQYLDGGGSFFLSNTMFSDFHPFGAGTFPVQYLGTSSVNMNTMYEEMARPIVADEVFGGMGSASLYWNDYGWTGYMGYTDWLMAGTGTECFEGYDGGFWESTALRYNSGTFKTCYFGFPIETLPEWYGSDLMERFVNWISEPLPDQSNEYIGAASYYDVGVGTQTPWAQSFVATQNSVGRVEFFMYSDSSCSDWFVVEIRADGGGTPAPTALASGTIEASDIPIGVASAGWVSCNIGATGLTIGSTYWIVCARMSTTIPQYWLADMSMSYPDGIAEEYNGGTWTGPMGYDWIFRVYSQAQTPGTPQTVVLEPWKDNTMYSEYPTNSNGQGEYILAGTDYYPHYRRGLLEFNIASEIPKHSTITDVSLSMYCANFYDTSSYDIWLETLSYEWGESTSNAPDMEETGTFAATGDATWDYTFYNTATWPVAGGTTSGGAGYTMVSTLGYYTWSTTMMAANLQMWLDDPSTNHGWLLRGEEGSTSSAKWFASGECVNPSWIPKLTVTYTEPTVIGYRDVFWIAGDTQGPTPPATAYKLIPSEGLEFIPMNDATTGQYRAVAIDDTGCPLFACLGSSSVMYYYDGQGWITIPDNLGALASYYLEAIDFNPNDRRFYIADVSHIFYSDPVPFEAGNSKCYLFSGFSGNGDDITSIAWNEYYDYGLVTEGPGLIKIWPWGETGNGTLRWQEIFQSPGPEWFFDVSWDTDGWNEAGIVGRYSTSRAYWRYYHTNPQLLDGYQGLAGTYYTCAFKPPSSPKWLFIPFGAGSIRINVEERDESSELIVSANFPHIFQMGMWRQSDVGHLPQFETQVEADSTYTFFLECNYTLGGVDQWDSSLGLYLQGWFDFGNTGAASQPGDATWTAAMFRTRQFNISYFPATATAVMNYPAAVGPVQEFRVHSVWEDPVNYGPDLSHYRIYINVTMGPQTDMAPGDGLWNSGNNWDVNSLNDALSWDFKAFAYDLALPEAHNYSFAEFGVQRFAAVSVSGNPTGSIPPGSAAVLTTPTLITYSSNTPYQVNVSIPNLFLNGDTGSPYFIPANFIAVMNEQGDDDIFNSDIWDWTAFVGPNDAWCVWGLEGGTYIALPGHGTVSAGPYYTDYTAGLVPEAFQPTPVRWQVQVPAGTPEGVYRGTITITIWN